MPSYEKQIFEQVQAQILHPHQQQVQNLLNALQMDLKSTKDMVL